MKVVILGAGRPHRGESPAALTRLARATRALDWQIGTFRSQLSDPHFVFVGGYGIEQIAPRYPQLDYIAAPDWAQSGALGSLLRASSAPEETLVSYADTVFHEAALEALLADPSEVVFGYDSEWRERYPHRSEADIEQAELVAVEERGQAEFTGLLKLGSEAARHLAQLSGDARDGTLVDLIANLRSAGFAVTGVDIAHQWAEFNDPRDIARFVLGTKAETLARLEGRLSKSRIEPQVSFSVAQWEADRESWVEQIAARFVGEQIIVRSSSAREDDWSHSAAGQFLSTGEVAADRGDAVAGAIDAVVASYGAEAAGSQDQVLVQRQVRDVLFAGVVLTCGLASGAPYYRINLEDGGGTDIVTAGREGHLRTVTIARDHTARLAQIDPALVPVIDAICEVEQLIAWERLDIEFAVDAQGAVHLFQIRPLVVDQSEIPYEPAEFSEQLETNIAQFERLQAAPAGVVGEKTIFGVMPDWNPGEIVGTRPRPLALDLYRRLVTDEVWSRQRAEFGYRQVGPHPLLAAFSGQPYVDVRASLNSFLPADLPDAAARRLIDAQLAILADNPALHDKIEFEIAFTVWDTALLDAARERYTPYGVTEDDIQALDRGLRRITREALQRLPDDTSSIETLKRLHTEIDDPARAPGDRAVALIEACTRYGTPAFAHAARAGFVAIALLERMTQSGALEEARRQEFLQSLDTVTRQMQADQAGGMPIGNLVEKYGHLRPGTYEITASAYWEDAETYFADQVRLPEAPSGGFAFEGREVEWCEQFLAALEAPVDVDAFTRYLRSAIAMRERTKFDFTRTLSRALDLCVEAATDWGLDRDALSFLGYADLRRLVFGAMGPGHAGQVVALNRSRHRLCQLTELPPLILSRDDFTGFEHSAAEPNFITLERALGPVVDADDHGGRLEGAIVLAQRADPGFDWLFGQKIAGLVTRYGGGNSHMAIRAAELGIPAVIGVGEMLFRSISKLAMVELDCAQRTIREIR